MTDRLDLLQRHRARFAGLAVLPLAGSLIVLAVACGDDASSAAPTSPDGGGGSDVDRRRDDAEAPTARDAAADADGPFAVADEQEPNNGATDTETNTMALPGRMNAAIAPAGDMDIFSVDVAPGELWRWTLAPKTAELAPHLAVFDNAPNNMNPTRVVTGAAGSPATLDQFVLRAGSFLAGVRDARNVPEPTGVGGPTFTYALEAVKRPVSAVAVTFPSTKSATLPSAGALDFYSFTAKKGAAFGIVINAERKAKPSTLDSRLSLFNVTTNEAIITNDNAGASKDSQIGGEIPEDGSYLAIVEHEGADPSDLSYDIVFQTTAPE